MASIALSGAEHSTSPLPDPAVRALPAIFYALLALPQGLGRGFVTITLDWLLAHHGFSIGEIATLTGLCLLPETWKVLVGPLLDLSLTPRRWFVLLTFLGTIVLSSFAILPLHRANMPLLVILVVLMASSFTAGGVSAVAAMAETTPETDRGAVAGWYQCGNLGGTGIGGGAGLWLATNGGGLPVAVAFLALCSLVSMAPIAWLRAPPKGARLPLAQQLRDLGAGIRALAQTRDGWMAMLVNIVPAGLGSGMQLLAPVAGDWHASAGLVALVLGGAGGLASLPGCVIGGYLADRIPRRTAFLITASLCAVAEAAMALGPRTPLAFSAFVLINTVCVGSAWATVAAVCFEQLRRQASASIAALLSSVSNIPVAGMAFVLGWVASGSGTNAMLLTEAGACALSVTGIAVLLGMTAKRLADD